MEIKINNKEYIADKINVSGDCQAYDIWYHVLYLDKEEWVQDLGNISSDDKDIVKILYNISKTISDNYNDIMFKFNFDIDI